MKDVLVVDDQDENRYFLEMLLRGHGYRVTSARHGAEALSMARSRPPDLVISDLLMPVMDGYTLLRHWRSDEQLYSKAFIVYTATYTEPEDERLALDLGADAFILKPAEPEDFLRRVDQVRSTHGARVRASRLVSPSEDNLETFKAYNGTLIRKLEQKTLQLEEANRTLHKDIEKLKCTEAALRHSEAEFRVLADVMPQIVWTSGPNGKVNFFNRLWAIYTGLEQNAGVNGWAECIHPDERDRELANWAKTVESGNTYTTEIRLRRCDGAFRWWLARAVPVFDETGFPAKWIGTFTDIHDLKETQESLRRSQRLEVVGQLTGGIAHDFNNILQVIVVNVENLGDADLLTPDIKKTIESIGRAVDRAGDLIRRLMTFSRQQSLEPEATDVNDLICSTSKLLRMALGDQVELVEKFDPELGWASIDRSQLEAAIVNLCVNARDAMPSGGRLTIETRNISLDAENAARFAETRVGDYVQIIVTDTGTGINPDVLDRVFEPFFTTKDDGSGTGLGLSMVYGFIKQSRGHVTLDSTPGEGTTVTLYLPRVPLEIDQQFDAGDQRALPRTERVLLVEDNPDVRSSVRTQLEILGYTVIEAESAPDALKACETNAVPFDLLLSDISMPGGMNGWALSEEVGRRWPFMARVLMSGNAEADAPDTTRRDTGVLVLPKPFRINGLARVLSEALSV